MKTKRKTQLSLNSHVKTLAQPQPHITDLPARSAQAFNCLLQFSAAPLTTHMKQEEKENKESFKKKKGERERRRAMG